MMNLQHEDEQKIETTLGGLKAAFAEWVRRVRSTPKSFLSDEEEDALTPEEYGEKCGVHFQGLLSIKPDTPSVENDA